jgi:hypothetical protein
MHCDAMRVGSGVRLQVHVTPSQQGHENEKSRQPPGRGPAVARRNGFSGATLTRVRANNKTGKRFQHHDALFNPSRRSPTGTSCI